MSPTSYEEVTRKLATFRPSRHVKMVWRRRQQVREKVTGKLVPVEFELNAAPFAVATGACRVLLFVASFSVTPTAAGKKDCTRRTSYVRRKR